MRSTKECRECWAPFEGESWQRLCWGCWRERRDREPSQARVREPVRVEPLLTEDALKGAIALCHPDRNPERIDLANRVTGELLDALQAVRRIGRAA